MEQSVVRQEEKRRERREEKEEKRREEEREWSGSERKGEMNVRTVCQKDEKEEGVPRQGTLLFEYANLRLEVLPDNTVQSLSTSAISMSNAVRQTVRFISRLVKSCTRC